MDLDFEAKRAKVAKFRPIDDPLFEVMAEDQNFVQEMLQVILEDDGLTVDQVSNQKSIRNLYGRSVRLDAICTLGNGKICNIEIQKADDDCHLKRVRYNEACITTHVTETGLKFEKIPDVFMIYISDFDLFNGEKTIYHVDKVIRENGQTVYDGVEEIYVNTKIDDNSKIADYMKLFKQTEIDEPKYPYISARIKIAKNGNGSGICVVIFRKSVTPATPLA